MQGVNTVGFQKIIIFRRRYWKLVLYIQIYCDGVFEGIGRKLFARIVDARQNGERPEMFEHRKRLHIHMSRSRFSRKFQTSWIIDSDLFARNGGEYSLRQTRWLWNSVRLSSFAISGSTTRGWKIANKIARHKSETGTWTWEKSIFRQKFHGLTSIWSNTKIRTPADQPANARVLPPCYF